MAASQMEIVLIFILYSTGVFHFASSFVVILLNLSLVSVFGCPIMCAFLGVCEGHFDVEMRCVVPDLIFILLISL